MAGARLFQQHRVRQIVDLDGRWEFFFPTRGTRISVESREEQRRIWLETPGVWESHRDLVNYRGEAVAHRSFTLDTAAFVRLVFKGVSHTVEVYVDGQSVGRHHNAFTPFELDVGELTAGDHEIALHISNAYGEISALHIPNDYYNYGGITRPAELQVLRAKSYVRRCHFTPILRSDGGWGAELRAVIVNQGAALQRFTLHCSLAGKHTELDVDLAGESETTVRSQLLFAAGEVVPWGPGNPQLYRLEATLVCDGEPVDDWADRVGFRYIEVRRDRLWLNGAELFLAGLNRHEDHPDHGCALPLSQLIEDVRILKDLGANAVRTSHYPNDERFLDLCDEEGLLVWEENHARGLNEHSHLVPGVKHPMKHPRFREQCRQQNEEMVMEHFNHPSIVVWGVLNECDSYSDYGRSCYREQLDQVKTLDDTRPHTYASCYPETDICQDLPDICSWNTYFDWYHGQPVASAIEPFLESLESRMQGKPFIMSEFGSGAIPGFRDAVRRARWSEDFQADSLDKSLGIFLHHPRLSGAFIWQFCDVRVGDEWALQRPRTMNNKGVVDEYRRPKLAYEVVKRHFRELKQKGRRAP